MSETGKRQPSTRATSPPRQRLPGIGRRISDIACALGSRRNLATAAGIHETQLYRYIKETSEPLTFILVALARAGGVTTDWLATGEGPRLANDRSLTVTQTSEPVGAETPAIEFAAIPTFGSSGNREPEIAKLAFRRDWLQSRGLVPKDLLLARISGDAMAPTIRDGALVLVDGTSDQVRQDGIYLLTLNEGPGARRLQRDAQGGLWIRCDNPAYREQHVTAAEIEALYVLGRVVWVAGEV